MFLIFLSSPYFPLHLITLLTSFIHKSNSKTNLIADATTNVPTTPATPVLCPINKHIATMPHSINLLLRQRSQEIGLRLRQLIRRQLGIRTRVQVRAIRVRRRVRVPRVEVRRLVRRRRVVVIRIVGRERGLWGGWWVFWVGLGRWLRCFCRGWCLARERRRGNEWGVMSGGVMNEKGYQV